MLAKQTGQKRFFYHYNKQARRMTVHFEGACLPADDLAVMVPAESKRNQHQPRVVMRGWASNIKSVPLENGRIRLEVW
jgi:hypothetical protein